MRHDAEERGGVLEVRLALDFEAPVVAAAPERLARPSPTQRLALGRATDDPLVGQAAPAFSRPLLDDPAIGQTLLGFRDTDTFNVSGGAPAGREDAQARGRARSRGLPTPRQRPVPALRRARA